MRPREQSGSKDQNSCCCRSSLSRHRCRKCTKVSTHELYRSECSVLSSSSFLSLHNTPLYTVITHSRLKSRQTQIFICLSVSNCLSLYLSSILLSYFFLPCLYFLYSLFRIFFSSYVIVSSLSYGLPSHPPPISPLFFFHLFSCSLYLLFPRFLFLILTP